MEWVENFKRSLGGAAAGAVAGAIISGGLLAIVGAALGGRRQDNSVAIVTVEDRNVELSLYFRCDKDEYKKLSKLMIL